MSHVWNRQLNYGLGQAKLCCNNKQPQNLWGLKPQRFISCSNYSSIMSCLEGSVRRGPHSATRTDSSLPGGTLGQRKRRHAGPCTASTSMCSEVMPPHLRMSHWPKQASWPRVAPRAGRLQSRHKRKQRRRTEMSENGPRTFLSHSLQGFL